MLFILNQLSGVAVAMKISVCLSDGLPCYCFSKKFCMKRLDGTVRICGRFYGDCISLFEYFVCKGIFDEFEVSLSLAKKCVADYYLVKANGSGATMSKAE